MTQQNTMPELKPCPLCGGDVEILNTKAIPHVIHCRKCQLFTRSMKNLDDAVKAWNTRYWVPEKTSTRDEVWIDLPEGRESGDCYAYNAYPDLTKFVRADLRQTPGGKS